MNDCEFCHKEKDLLVGTIERFNDACLFGMKHTDLIKASTVYQAFERDEVRVFYDTRGYLRLVRGEDIGCLDHSMDILKTNYCPMCGIRLSGVEEE